MTKFRQVASSIFVFLSLCSANKESSSPSTDQYVQNECLRVSQLEFSGAAKTAVEAIRKAGALVSKFDKKLGKSRVANAIYDCVELLESASEELSWIISASQNPNGKDNSTGDMGSDLKTWISAAFSNQDTCLDGFEGTNGIIKKLVSSGLNQVGKTVRNLLTMVHSPSKPKPKSIKAQTGHSSFTVSGRGFIARDITFQNTAGPEKHQAVAIRSDSDLAVFYRCAMRGYQDTLYAHTMRQFFKESIITGTVDFIFGDATAIFQNCQIKAKQGLPNQKNSITAQGRKDPNQPTGFTIQLSNITADSDLLPNLNITSTYLGRPWKLYSRTVFLQNYMSEVLKPEGWLEWNGEFALDTLFYAEYMNNGPGASLDRRVKWLGYHVFNTSAEARNFTVSEFIKGNLWLPATGISYIAGLTS